MISREESIRVRYCDTDQMGYLHHSRYAQYYEASRTELIREIIGSYKEMEDRGLILPVLALDCKFIRSALYDDVLSVKTIIKEVPSVRIKFYFEVHNQDGVLLNTGSTTLVFVNKETRKPMRAPKEFIDKIKEFSENEKAGS